MSRAFVISNFAEIKLNNRFLHSYINCNYCLVWKEPLRCSNGEIKGSLLFASATSTVNRALSKLTKEKKLNNRSPYETFSFYYGEKVLQKLGCYPVAARDIMLKPALLKK